MSSSVTNNRSQAVIPANQSSILADVEEAGRIVVSGVVGAGAGVAAGIIPALIGSFTTMAFKLAEQGQKTVKKGILPKPKDSTVVMVSTIFGTLYVVLRVGIPMAKRVYRALKDNNEEN